MSTTTPRLVGIVRFGVSDAPEVEPYLLEAYGELAGEPEGISPAPRAQRLTYRARRLRRAERYRGWAEKREARAEGAYERASELGQMIPLGQPILVGHHSESRHRRDLQRIDAAMRQSVVDDAKARSMRSRADTIESQAEHAIYSDDPDAIERLCEKLARMEAQRETMKQANAAFRKAHRDELKALSAFGRDRAMPHPGYELQNLGGNISRTRQRIAQLQRQAA